MNEIEQLKEELETSLRKKGYYPPEIVDRLIELLEVPSKTGRKVSLSSVQTTDILPKKPGDKALERLNTPNPVVENLKKVQCSHEVKYGPGPDDYGRKNTLQDYETEIRKALRENG